MCYVVCRGSCPPEGDDGGCDPIGVGSDAADMQAHVMVGVGVGGGADCSHDRGDFVCAQQFGVSILSLVDEDWVRSRGSQVVGAQQDADGCQYWT